MRKIICDRCSKEIQHNDDVCVVVFKFSKREFEGHSIEFELCTSCFKSTNNFVVHYETSA